MTVHILAPRQLIRELRYLLRLRVLPARVARFQWRAHRLASRMGDRFSLISATRPDDLAVLLALACNRHRIVELGTGTGWTALALALDDPMREVVTYDPIERPERRLYLDLTKPDVRARVTCVVAAGNRGPSTSDAVDLLYIDSAHDRRETIEELRAWNRVLAPGALIVFDDFTHPDFPGVGEAVRELELPGTQHGTLFVHQVR
jgi:predicted O-methyltransferase YrrM